VGKVGASKPFAAPKSVAKAAALAQEKPIITQDQIALRAYEISISGTGGSELENWLRAERELKA
jgi:hypothetical protein